MDTELPGEQAALKELGKRLTQARLDSNFTQEGLASAAAVSKSTIERLEMGQSIQLSNLVRVLGALGLGSNLELLAPPAGPRPMDLLRHERKSRKRASAPKAAPGKPWTWDDKRT